MHKCILSVIYLHFLILYLCYLHYNFCQHYHCFSFYSCPLCITHLIESEMCFHSKYSFIFPWLPQQTYALIFPENSPTNKMHLQTNLRNVVIFHEEIRKKKMDLKDDCPFCHKFWTHSPFDIWRPYSWARPGK